jgi:hypothetical protein
MTIPAYTVYANHPRLFFRDTDRTAIVARTDSTSAWKTRWDATIVPASNSYRDRTTFANPTYTLSVAPTNPPYYLAAGQTWANTTDGCIYTRNSTNTAWVKNYPTVWINSNTYISQVNSPHQRMMVLALAGYIEETGRPENGYKDKVIKAAVHLASLPDSFNPTTARYRLLALALVFDILYADTTTTEKNTLAAEIVQQCDRMASRTDEWMDGHSGNDQMCQAAGALAIHGWGTYTAAAQTRLTESMTFFFGVNPNEGSLEMERYQFGDGGSEKGAWYIYLGLWHALWSMLFFSNGTTLNEWTSESSWASKIWEWLLWSGYRGGVDGDYEAMGDMARASSPKMHSWQRWVFGALATRYPTGTGHEGGRHLAWMFDQWDAQDAPYADSIIYDVLFFDRANVTSVSPEAASTPPATTRLFSPPGVAYVRRAARGSAHSAWDYDNSCVFRISARSGYYLGHPHLDAGSVQIRFRDDVLLLSPSGYYDEYGGSHHAAWYQRTCGQSLAPIIYDPSEVYQRWSDVVPNDGGQHFKKRLDASIVGGIASDPYSPYKMLNDDGGEAWKRTERFVKIPGDDTAGQFFIADILPAYKKFHTDAGRLEVCTIKYLIIEPTAANGLTWSALLYYARVRKRNASHVVTIPMHFRHTATARSFGLDALGYRSEVGNGSPGRLWVDVRDIGSYNLTITGPGTPLNAAGYGPTQFQILGAGTNYPPAAGAGTRYLPDLKRYSAYLQRKTQVQEEHYVALLMVAAAGDSEPVSGRAWVSDVAQPDFYGIGIGSETYLIHRTQDLAVYGSGATPDATPPAEVTDHALTPRDRRILSTFTDPADSDYAKARIYYRTSEITP